ncbi:DUF4246 family protein, partial [Candidatus Bathyarchaeota archaeon]|nr:DUF4246 family protein [Candidatus Bathyarchaeota archaeon]
MEGLSRQWGKHWDPPLASDLPPLDDAEKERIKARHGDLSGCDSANEDEDPWHDCDDADMDPRIINWVNVREPVQPKTPHFHPRKYSTPEGETLREVFKNDRLQVIVKMTSIELTPEKPRFPGGYWHVDGLMNEHIVATAVYYPDSENITASRLAFRALQEGWDQGCEEEVVEETKWGEEVYG